MDNKTINLLTKPFDPKTIGVKVQSFNGASKIKAMLVLYAQHTDVANRLDETGLNWSFHLESPIQINNSWTVKGVLRLDNETRENYGDGNDLKSAASDAFKRAAMLFGIGRYLYDSEPVWVPYNDATDKYKNFTYDDYMRAAKKIKPVVESRSQQAVPAPKPVLKNHAPVLEDQDLKHAFYCEFCGAKHVLTTKGNWVCPSWIKEMKNGTEPTKHSKSFPKEKFDEMIALQIQRQQSKEAQMGLTPKF